MNIENDWIEYHRNASAAYYSHKLDPEYRKLELFSSVNHFLYYKDNYNHCLEGPAVIKRDGSCEWWLNGIQFSEEEYKKMIKMKAFW